MPPNNERRIALFIDFENLVTNTGITPSNFDLQPALDRLLEKGKVVFRRAYCDWSRFRDAKQTLHDLGVELVDVPPSTRAGKNAADMRLVIDAIELCYAREHIDTYVIASGDSDFCPLAYKLRENDRTVIGLGVREATSPLFVRACDEFLYLKPPELRHRSERREKPAATAPSGGGRPQKQVPEIAREVACSLLASASGPLNPSLIKETIVRKEPDFDEREHGFASFSRLLEALEKEGLLRMQQASNRQWYVVAPEAAAKPVVPPVTPAAEPVPETREQEQTRPEAEAPAPQPPDEGVLEPSAEPTEEAAPETETVEPKSAPVAKKAAGKRTSRGGRGRRPAAKTARAEAPGEVAGSNGKAAPAGKRGRSRRGGSARKSTRGEG